MLPQIGTPELLVLLVIILIIVVPILNSGRPSYLFGQPFSEGVRSQIQKVPLLCFSYQVRSNSLSPLPESAF